MRRMTLAHLPIQFVQRIEDPVEDVATAGCQAVDTRRLGTLRLRRTQPATGRHPRQHRIQRARAQAVTMVMQLFEHPLTVHTPFGGMVENVNLPEGEEELTNDWIAHGAPIICHSRRRATGTSPARTLRGSRATGTSSAGRGSRGTRS